MTNYERIKNRSKLQVAESLVFYAWGEWETPSKAHYKTREEAVQKTLEWLDKQAT